MEDWPAAARRMGLVARPSGPAPETPPSGEGMPSGSVDKAARESQRRDFLRVFNEQLEDLQRDPEAWADYWAEAELTSVADGIDETTRGEPERWSHECINH